MSNFSNLSNRFKYWTALALAEDGPQEKVRAEMMKQGWQFKSGLTQEDALRNVIASGLAGPVGCITFPRTKIYSPEGQEVFTQESDPALQKRYREEVRATAARVYGIKP